MSNSESRLRFNFASQIEENLKTADRSIPINSETNLGWKKLERAGPGPGPGPPISRDI